MPPLGVYPLLTSQREIVLDREYLRCEYSTRKPAEILENPNVLAVVDFAVAENSCPLDTLDSRYLNTGLRCLGPAQQIEVWYGEGQVSSGRTNDIAWSTDGVTLFAAFSVPETLGTDLAELSCDAYKRLLALCTDMGFEHITRAWNYFDSINHGEEDLERYKLFCAGRYNAFMAAGYDTEAFPAASALGSHGGPLLIYILASKSQAQRFENPLQVSAYNYPRQYGPTSPSFARASVLQSQDQHYLYLSGTASVVGHKSVYAGNLNEQQRVTFENISRVYQHASGHLLGEDIGVRLAVLKVYIRNPSDYENVKSNLENSLYSGAQVIYLNADICRDDLLLEIDGLCLIAGGVDV